MILFRLQLHEIFIIVLENSYVRFVLITMRLAPESDSGVVIQPVMQRDSER